MAFADPLKDAVHRIFRIPVEVLWGDSSKRDTRTRKILQELGTDFARKFDSEVWVNRILERIERIEKGEADYLELLDTSNIGETVKIVIPDVRFPNEAQALVKQFDAKLIRVWRPGAGDSKDPETRRHKSETSVNEIPKKLFTYTFLNNGTREEALQRAEELVELIDD